jgi:hypothetical protein
MSTVLTYVPSEVRIIINGYIMTDIVSVNVEWGSASFGMVKGIRGRNTRRQSLDSSATLSLEILQTSTSNDVLTELLVSDLSLQSSRLQVSIKDTSGSTDISSDEAYISSFPTVTFNDALNSRTWVIQMLETSASVKGNAKPLPDIFNSAGSFIDNVTSTVTDYAKDSISNLF